MSDETATATPEPAQPRAAGLRDTALTPATILAGFALGSALILSLVDDLTRDAIARRATEDLHATLAQVIPAERHDNDVTQDAVTLTDELEGAVLVYRARAAGTVTGVAFEMSAEGYSGRIVVLIGVARDGTILGTRVLSHTETPGLGDKIEAAKSDWIERFTGLSLGNPEPEGWAVKRDGGTFDQFSGATITPRATVEAIHRGLEFFARNRDGLIEDIPEEQG